MVSTLCCIDNVMIYLLQRRKEVVKVFFSSVFLYLGFCFRNLFRYFNGIPYWFCRSFVLLDNATSVLFDRRFPILLLVYCSVFRRRYRTIVVPGWILLLLLELVHWIRWLNLHDGSTWKLGSIQLKQGKIGKDVVQK